MSTRPAGTPRTASTARGGSRKPAPAAATPSLTGPGIPTAHFPLLSALTAPADLRTLTHQDLAALAAEIRAFLIGTVCATGGHLGPNLGVVELTIALHRVFASPWDTLLFDIGHQGYVHKLLTGRAAGFDRLRRAGGPSGYLSRAESPHDVIENSHASTVLSYADGLAKARHLTGEDDRAVVAVIGDGALTGGMCWEALNNLGAAPERPVIIVLNDNTRSYAPTIGALADHLQHLRSTAPDSMDWLLQAENRAHQRLTVTGPGAVPRADGNGYGAPDVCDGQDGDARRSGDGGDGEAAVLPGPLPVARNLFHLLGFAYLGPVDGHHLPSLEEALTMARELRRPVVVHAVTVKGRGYAPAETDAADCMHAIGTLDPATGRPTTVSSAPSWTSVFAQELCALGEQHQEIVAITAAMPGPTGLARFAERFPTRFFDVGIAEQHAVTSAAGLALGGLHPVVAVYATFLGRAFDQVLMDVALHRLPVTFVLDRAGITGPDGPSHHGMWDLTLLGAVPGMRVAVPRDAARLRELLAEAVTCTTGPTALRFAKAAVTGDIPAYKRLGPVEVLHQCRARDVLLVAVGPLAGPAVEAACYLEGQGIGVTVADPRWVLPVPAELVDLAVLHRLVVTVEDHTRVGGAGTAVARAIADAGSRTPVRVLGLPGRFLTHGTRTDILSSTGLTAQGIAYSILRARANHPDDNRGQ
ncbi:1-deoxy-D-xylulose-5-phosphate synthase [Streptomyces sp. ET3-23]|uniref:1-deoxy-D-xylulose-5-phosphate synthase n=1 Tax=Streptomyces sp. ET3-23 TaxID=2885643 RepID=UPI001D11A030|nr:1-deoxy-D-xylulose-5-phosphate synthase [Streptomyces sp. ET3-23]MCC2280657.1 1-deoxy-D-xylulose-5-phosphate synthase [Streptomyces sp. ET3-23]